MAAAANALKHLVEGEQPMAAEKKIENTWRQVRVDVEVPVAAPPVKVWAAMTRDVSEWWPVSFCADPKRAKSFHWELKLGGRMYEDWGDGNGWMWWTIFKLDVVNHVLCATGNMGGGGMFTEIEFKLHAEGTQTVLRIKEIVSGPMDDPAALDAGQVQGWNTLFRDAFKMYVEKTIG